MLDCLPAELLRLISSYLVNKKHLAHLIRSSRRLYIVLQQVLYTDVFLYGYKGSSRVIKNFLCTVTRAPRLADHVRSLRVMGMNFEKSGIKEDKVEVDGNLLQKLLSERIGYTEEEKSRWLKDLDREEHCDCWLALLIPQLKQLRRLSINWPYAECYVFDMITRAVMEKEPILRHLEEISVNWRVGFNGVPTHRIFSFFSLPLVRKIRCDKVAEYDESGDNGENDGQSSPIHLRRIVLPPRSSSITHIEMTNANAGKGMQELVRACKTLKSFRILIEPLVCPRKDYQPRKIYESLFPHRLTLKCLWIEPNDGCYTDTYDEWIGSFAHFSNLETIVIPFPNLVGFDEHSQPMRRICDVLPRSLKILYLILREGDGFITTMEQLVELATLKYLPSLSAVHLQSYSLEISENVAKLEWAKQKYEGTGILFFFHCSDDDVIEGVKPNDGEFISSVNGGNLLGWTWS